jgi:serine O-acetyltransferase
MWKILVADALELRRAAKFEDSPRGLLKALLTTDGFRILAMNRVRELARKHKIPGVNTLLRSAQQAMAGIEIGKEVTLGEGVYFVHPVGVVIGGDSRIGNRVRFYGSNTIGTASDNGYPTIEDDVWIGAGARILGPIRIGARSHIGANAVVLSDVPPDSVVVGIPAKHRPRGNKAEAKVSAAPAAKGRARDNRSSEPLQNAPRETA